MGITSEQKEVERWKLSRRSTIEEEFDRFRSQKKEKKIGWNVYD